MKKSKVVIIGGGFGGVFAAKALSRHAKNFVEIELISDRNYFVFQPLLPEVAAGTINSQDAVTPLRQLLPNVKVRLASVEHIDCQAQTVTLLQGRKRILQKTSFDHLVISSGQVTDLSFFPGFSPHSLKMKDLSDAFILRNHLVQCMELADVTELEEVKKMALTFVVAGGGFSGVETFGEVLEMVHRICRFYPNIKKEEINAVIIQRGNNLLMEMPEALGRYAIKQLEKRGATVMLNTGIESASATTVSTSQGDVIHTMTVVTTIGNAPSRFVKNLPFEIKRGKIIVNTHLQISGHRNIWSLGDAAAVPLAGLDNEAPQIAPPTAQFAVQEAKVLAINILNEIRGKQLKSFNYTPKGMLASLGAYKGVAQLWKFRITGLPAWFIWRFLYIGMLPGFATRVRVALNWLFDYFMPRTIVQIAQPTPSAIKKVHYREDELVYDRNELIPGFFIVAEGRFKLTFTDENDTTLEKILNVGDHGGNQAIQADRLTQGKLEAVEAGALLFIDRDDFKQLCSAIPIIKAHYDAKTDDRIKALHR